jgi:hypothetical protein
MLFKTEYFPRFSDGIAKSLSTFSSNAALSIVVIWDAVRFHLYDVDLGRLINVLERELPSDDPLGRLPFEMSESAHMSLAESNYRILSARFYHYYLSRLPILFRYYHIIKRHRKRSPSTVEIKNIVRQCVRHFSESFSDINCALTNDEYFRFSRLRQWFVRPSVRWDAVYSVEWLWAALRTTYPDILAADNTGSITNHVIESSFPMFWDRFAERYLYCMKFYASSGWFVGDMDINELDSALMESEHKNPTSSGKPALHPRGDA